MRSLWIVMRRVTGQGCNPLALGAVVLLVILCVSVPTGTTATGPRVADSQATTVDAPGSFRGTDGEAVSSGLSSTPAPSPVAFGGGQVVLGGTGPGISEQQRQEVEAETQRNIRELRLQGWIQESGSVDKVMLAWPMRAAPGFTDYGYYSLCSFVDHDPAWPDHVLDYNCGTRSHDRAGYNHAGTDYCPWPFWWLKMDLMQVEVVAAAGGVIVGREDGHFDRHCGDFTGQANYVSLLHEDGSTTYYYHFKSGSVTPKGVGETVAAGEYLGVPGSSGPSGGPHLHFEVHDPGGNLIDPYQGPCNDLNPDSWWISQRPYYDSGLNKLATGFAPPVFPPCPEDEIPNEGSAFRPGDTIYFVSYYRDQLSGQESVHTVYRPDGSVYLAWSHSSDEPWYEASYWYWAWVFPGDAQTGVWRYEIAYEGQVYEHSFLVGFLDNSLFLPLMMR